MDYPFCANEPQFVYHKHHDIDEQAARLTGYEQTYQQLSRGRFEGSFLSREIDEDMGLFFETTNQVLFQSGVVPNGYYAIGLLMSSNNPLIFNTDSFAPGSAFLVPPNSELQGTSEAGMHICVIHISSALLNKFCDQEYMKPVGQESDFLSFRLVKNNKQTRAIYALINDFLDGVDDGSLSLANDNQRITFKNALATAVEWVFVGKDGLDADQLEGSRNKRRQVFHDACDLIHPELREGIDIISLCDRIGVARRTLEYAFTENMGMSPGKYIKLLRLNNIRREIISTENSAVSIGDLASHWGVWHLGRFSQEYHTLFGELPSTTRKQVRHN